MDLEQPSKYLVNDLSPSPPRKKKKVKLDHNKNASSQVDLESNGKRNIVSNNSGKTRISTASNQDSEDKDGSKIEHEKSSTKSTSRSKNCGPDREVTNPQEYETKCDSTKTSKRRQQRLKQNLRKSQHKRHTKPKLKEICRYGNYKSYYGNRKSATGSGIDSDDRLQALEKSWFGGKDVLDIGCNIGHVTLLVARDFEPHHITGIDIDQYLVEVAGKNIKHYIKDKTESCTSTCNMQPQPENTKHNWVPFPYNVSFRQEDYVLGSDRQLKSVSPEFDVITCFSVTKWVHLNNADNGLKRFFRRAFLHLRPGGRFIVEIQPWSSYKKPSKMTEFLRENYNKIRFTPEQFEDYLLQEVGFQTVERRGTPLQLAKGFNRPILVFNK